MPAVRLHAVEDPDAGVRRHLIVVLASFGEWAAVETLAAGDPDPYVRATALRCLHNGGRDDAARGALADASPVVVEAAIECLGPGWPEDRLPELVRYANVPYLRAAVIDVLASRRLPAEAVAALGDVLLNAETYRGQRSAIWSILLAHDRALALRVAGQLSHDLQVELLELLPDRAPWAELSVLDVRRLGPWRLSDHVRPEHGIRG